MFQNELPIEYYTDKSLRAASKKAIDEDKAAKQAALDEEEAKKASEPQGAYDPETGKINWDCPCLGGMANGPCGEEFKAAFSCFVYSESEPKGIDCIEAFKTMQSCFRKYPDVYASELSDDEVPIGEEVVSVEVTEAPELEVKEPEVKEPEVKEPEAKAEAKETAKEPEASVSPEVVEILEFEVVLPAETVELEVVERPVEAGEATEPVSEEALQDENSPEFVVQEIVDSN